MKKALAIGINHYEFYNDLNGCITDAQRLTTALRNNADSSRNFDVECIESYTYDCRIDKQVVKRKIRNLFKEQHDVALLYFSGHGYVEELGGYLVTTECEHGDDGVSLYEIIQMANLSPSDNKIIVLDCCHSGITGNPDANSNIAALAEGVTILTASEKNQYAVEEDGSGVFTNYLIEALEGGAANLLGQVSIGSLYAYIDRSFGSWKQRPLFKSHVKGFCVLRTAPAPIDLKSLKKICKLFPNPEKEFQLNPSFEPESECPNKANTQRFKILQKYNRLNLLIPVGEEHMYHAAMHSKSCALTFLGKHYWQLVNENLI